MRTHTPPELKWLLVERATVAGDIERLKNRQRELAAMLDQQEAALDALDETIRIVHASVNPGAAGTVFRHSKKYGGRGGLTQYVISLLHAAPTGLTLRKVIDLVIAHFELDFISHVERKRFGKQTVQSLLQRLRAQSQVECVSLPGQRARLWRLVPAHPSLEQLLALAVSTNASSNNAHRDPA